MKGCQIPMETFFVKFLASLFLIALFQIDGCNGCLEKERIGVLKVKNFFISISDKEYADDILTTWVDDPLSDCCGWEGVQCNTTTRQVMKLSLNRTRQINSIYFHGLPTLDFSLFLPFQELQSLDLSWNGFEGWDENKTNYDGFGSWKQLKTLNLSGNFFNDSVFPCLNTLTSLTTLILGVNRIEGLKQNQGFANLTNLKVLDLSNNRINGSTTELGLANLINLEELDLSFNRISGLQGLSNLTKLKILNLSQTRTNRLATHMGLSKLRNLKELHLSENNINGYFESEELSNLRNLEVLDLSYNAISGIGLTNLTNLKVLDIRDNYINGSLAGLSKFKNLKVLDAGWNNINCSLKSLGICELQNLVELDLSRNIFPGGLPECLNNLTNLKVLDISQNQLSGNLPSIIANPTTLEYLDLTDNNFEGIFSLASLANHSKLEVLLLSTQSNSFQLKTENWLPTFQLKVFDLSGCNLNGTIPSFLLHQHDLKFLDLSDNKLVDNFPAWLLQNNTKLEALNLGNNLLTGIIQLPGSNHDLHYMDLSDNCFIGKIPHNIGTILPKLRHMVMSKNSFEGNIPSSIVEMKGLFLMDFSKNEFSGELFNPLFASCMSLHLLDLSENNFYGKISPTYTNLTRLEWLYLDNNHFSGKIKDGLLNFTALKGLDVSNNKLSGHIPTWIGNFSYLEVLLMSENCLQGNIPIQLNNLKFLRILDISENNLSGFMVSSLNLSFIEHIYMQKNALGGSIPNFLFRRSKLRTLDLSDNDFSGRIPYQINEYSDLRVLLLGGNQLQGQIPNQLCRLQKLGILDLSRNSLNGSIPSCFADVLFWKVGNENLYGYQTEYAEYIIVDLVHTYYNYTLHLLPRTLSHEAINQHVKVHFATKNRYEFYNGSNLNYMAGLDLSCNKLTGEIPSEIGGLQGIRGINLSHNFLSGFIPASFSNLKMIESLDLSHNRLSGQISLQLTELNYLSTFNVSYNYLSGKIPDKRQFATFDNSSYIGNPGLCGETINKSCINLGEEMPVPSSNGGEEDKIAIDMVSFIWSFGASFVTFILGLFAILWVNSYWRKLWFSLVEVCIDLCYYWLFKCVYFFRDRVR